METLKNGKVEINVLITYLKKKLHCPCLKLRLNILQVSILLKEQKIPCP